MHDEVFEFPMNGDIRRMRKKSGFTLIEIMVTVGVISLLASLASIAVLKAHRKALQKQTETELNLLSAAVLNMAWDTGRWPNKDSRAATGSTEIWNIQPATVGLMATDGTFNNWRGPYYEGAVLDPWGSPYFFDPDYLINGVNHPVVGSFGPNRQGRNLYDQDDIYILLDD